MSKIKMWANDHRCSILVAVLLSLMLISIDALSGTCSARSLLFAVLESVAVVYIVHNLRVVFTHPVKFDWLLSRGTFIWRIAIFVLSFPIFIAFCIHLLSPVIGDSITPAEVAYSAEMFGDSREEWRDRSHEELSEPSLLWTLYYHFTDPGNQHTTLTYRGRLIAGICATFGVILLNGLLVSVLIGAFDVRRERWRTGIVRYSRFLRRNKRGHYVIIGGSDMDTIVVQSIFNSTENASEKTPYILIQTDSDIESLRNHLYSGLSDVQQRHLILYSGSRTLREDVEDLILERAIKVYLLGESGVEESNESMHDTYSMRCIEYIGDYIKRHMHNEGSLVNADNPLEVNVLFEHQTTFSIYQLSDMQTGFSKYITFKPMNYYEMWAQKVLVCDALGDELNAEYIPLEGTGITADSDDFVHLVIVGMSRMGVALGVEATHLAHYPNFETKHKRTRITFIDPDMEREYNYFRGRFRGFFELARYRYADVSRCDYATQEQGIYYNENYGKWIEPWTTTDDKGRGVYDHLGGDFIDVEWEFIRGSIEMPVLQQYLIDAAHQKGVKLTVAICLPEPNSAAAAALYLPREVYNSQNVQQVLVYQRYDDSLFCNLSEMRYKTPFNGLIKPFGMISGVSDLKSFEVRGEWAKMVGEHYNKESVYSGAYEREWLASLSLSKYDSLFDYLINSDDSAEWVKSHRLRAEEANNIYNRIVGEVAHSNYADTIEKLLEQCREQEGKLNKNATMKAWSNTYNANSLWTKLRCVGYKPGEPLSVEQVWNLSCVEHARWNMEQLLLSQMPINKSELKVWIASGANKRSIKDLYKAERKHPNISSLAMIHSLDKIFYYDVALSIFLAEGYDYCCRRLQK